MIDKVRVLCNSAGIKDEQNAILFADLAHFTCIGHTYGLPAPGIIGHRQNNRRNIF